LLPWLDGRVSVLRRTMVLLISWSPPLRDIHPPGMQEDFQNHRGMAHEMRAAIALT
jgi:hypothetical protein